MASRRIRLFLAHGETKARRALARLVRERYGIKAELPAMDSEVTI
jgi:predicted metal-dependent RNase